MANESEVKTWNMLAHLSALAGLMIPFGNIIGPLLVWQIKKAEIPSVEKHGKDALNFQITATLILFAALVVAFILTIVVIGMLLFPLIGLAWLAAIGLSVYAGIQANNGVEFRYPINFNLIK
ncbi:MAG: DUF4870 domain-containing protein [Candidatus Methylacidiphilales bacterium]|nr:DUF4870 domain-containing protein [Candidatus Methylacidiphilales bacterium]